MRCIRSPAWDGLWFLSGPVLAVVFAAELVPWRVLIYTFIAINTAHLISPIALAWLHVPYRDRIALKSRRKHIAWPGLILLMGLVCGLASPDFQINPLSLATHMPNLQDIMEQPLIVPMFALLSVYFLWNAYHFGMQNYGMGRLYFPGADKSMIMQASMFCTILFLLVFPEKYQITRLSLFFLGLVIFNHQLVAIGLSSHIWSCYRNKSPWLFVIPLLAIGAIVSLSVAYGQVSARIAMVLIGFRACLGIVHFGYDRMVYKFSDPLVRETIGRDLFAAPRVIEPFPALAD